MKPVYEKIKQYHFLYGFPLLDFIEGINSGHEHPLVLVSFSIPPSGSDHTKIYMFIAGKNIAPHRLHWPMATKKLGKKNDHHPLVCKYFGTPLETPNCRF